MMRMRLQQRPWTLFDPANKEHRAYFNAFLKTQSWSECPVQWVITDSSNDVVHHLSRILLEYYTSVEFKPKKPRTVKTVAKKPQK
jgi:hypothetical protein